MSDDQRLARIEDRLDRIGDAIERIARTEERVLALMDFVNRLDSRLESVEKGMNDVKDLAVANQRKHNSNEWIWKTILTAGISAVCAALALRHFV